MKVFISQPMRGKTYSELVDERNAIKDSIRADFGNNIEFIDSLFLDGEKEPLKSLAKSLSLLADADYAVFTGEWYNSHGCATEHQCCVYYDIPILRHYMGYKDNAKGFI